MSISAWAMAGVLAAQLTQLDADDRSAHRGGDRHQSRLLRDLRVLLPASGRRCPGLGFAGMVERPPGQRAIAAIEGFAPAGGSEIALACDLFVCGRTAKLGLPEVSVGLRAGGGGPLRLPRQIAYLVALPIVLTGQPINAEVAHQVGLVNELTDSGDALAAARSRQADRRERPADGLQADSEQHRGR